MSQTSLTPGQRFREAVATEHPLQVVGTINACLLYTSRCV